MSTTGSAPSALYQPRSMKRIRRTAAAIEQLQRQIFDVLQGDHPQSVRHCFYRMTDPRLPEPVQKSDRGYVAVQRQLVQMRRAGIIPYGWVTDATRRGYFTDTWNSPAEAVAQIASFYRRSYWPTAPCYVEVWCESRSIAGIIEGDCRHYAVPLYPAGGFTSHTLAWEAAQNIAGVAGHRPVHILYIGDHDPAGVLIDRKIEDELRRHLDGQELHFHRLAITVEQILLMGLPTKPAKDQRGGFIGGTVEAEAMPASDMRQLLREAIDRFIDQRELTALEATEDSERASLHFWAGEIARTEARP